MRRAFAPFTVDLGFQDRRFIRSWSQGNGDDNRTENIYIIKRVVLLFRNSDILHYIGLTRGEGEQTKLPTVLTPNDLPHRPLVLCLNLPDDHGHFDEV